MQTHAQAAYLAGAIVCELESRGYAGKDGLRYSLQQKLLQIRILQMGILLV